MAQLPVGRPPRGLVAARPFHTDRPSQYALNGLHEALVAAGVPEVRSSINVGRFFSRIPVWNPGRLRQRSVVVGMMGPRERDLAAHTLHGRAIAYCWDVWPANLPAWNSMLRRHPVAMAVTTSQQAAEALRSGSPNFTVCHLPEATNPDQYDPTKPLTARKTGVLELGRRSQKWHDAVSSALVSAGVRHVFQSDEHSLIFPHAQGMRRGLGDAVISVCLPSSTTHPVRSGSFCTVTHRYFESMASGCIVLGEAPDELVALFGYNPVIEIDWADPIGQLIAILTDPGRHQALVDRNLERVREVGSWSARVTELLALIERELR